MASQTKYTSQVIQQRLGHVADKILNRWEKEQQQWDKARNVFQNVGLQTPDFTAPPTNLTLPQSLHTSAGRAALLQSAGQPTLGGLDPVNVGVANLGNVLAAGQAEKEKVAAELNKQAMSNANVVNKERLTQLEMWKPTTQPGTGITAARYAMGSGSGFKLNDLLGYAKFVKTLTPKEPVDIEELKGQSYQIGDVNPDGSVDLTEEGMTVRQLPPKAQHRNEQVRQFVQSAEVAKLATLYAGAPALRSMIDIPQTDIVVWKDNVEPQHFGRDNVNRVAAPVKVPADVAPVVFQALDSSNYVWNAALQKLIVTVESLPEGHPLVAPLQDFIYQQLDQLDPRMADIVVSEIAGGQ